MKKEKKNEIIIEYTTNFEFLLNSKARYQLLRGSTRSSKSVSIIQYLLSFLMNNKNISVVIGVETLQSAKKSILEDLDEWINIFNLNDYIDINKTDYIYKFKNKSKITILSADKSSKWFGVKADIFWFNEATHIDYSIFEQAQMRLPDKFSYNKFILDFNPTNPWSWVRDLENSDLPGGVETFVSTYKDNPFLGKKQIELIESWKETNYNKYLVYGKGEYGEVEGAILKNWETIDKFPEEISNVWYGMDFGYTNDPTTLIKVGLMNNEIYCEELLYEKGMTNQDIIKFLKDNKLENVEIIADSAEPKSIEEIKRGGIRNFYGVSKGTDSIKNGIDILLRYKINITKTSKNLIDEIINYTWKKDKIKSEFMNIPVDGWDHLIDPLRYIGLTKLNIKIEGRQIIFRKVKRNFK